MSEEMKEKHVAKALAEQAAKEDTGPAATAESPAESADNKPAANEVEARVAQRITVTLFANGQLQIEGPLHDQLLMLGLLEMAKNGVADHARMAAAKRVTPPLINRLMAHGGINNARKN